MKTLILLRHAKSSWDDLSLRDHERPLAQRGLRAAPAVAAYLRALGAVPDFVLSSTSVRTRQTIQLASDHLDTPATEFDESLYHAGPGQLLRAAQSVPDAVDTLMLVGHNPGMHECALELASDDSPDALMRRLYSKFPTAAVAVLEFDVDRWVDISPGEGLLRHFIRPKDLPDARRDGP